MNMLDKIILFLSTILSHCRKELFKNNQKKITLRVYKDKDKKSIKCTKFINIIKNW